MSAQPQWDEDELVHALSTWQPADTTPVTENSWRPFPVYSDEQTWEPHVRLSVRAHRAVRAWAGK